MIQYKLIKEYPGSPKLGTLANKEFSFSSDSYMLSDKFRQPLPLGRVENYPEFWKRVDEVDYEILSYSLKARPTCISTTKRGGDIHNEHWNIHSVKRLSVN